MNDYQLGCFTLDVLKNSATKNLSALQFKTIIACAKNGKTAIQTTLIIDTLKKKNRLHRLTAAQDYNVDLAYIRKLFRGKQ